MAKYKVGDIFINHTDGKILQVCEGGCYEGCCYMSNRCKGTFNMDTPCRNVIGSYRLVKELPFLPPGTKVKVRENLKVGTEYERYTFVENMKQNKEVTIERYFASHKAYSVAENACNYTFRMFDQVINEPKENNNMETKEIKIKVPEGYEIDKENSTFECIKFKPIKKELTYKDVAEELFFEGLFAIDFNGEIRYASSSSNSQCDRNNATNKEQLERLLALNQLLNIAEYYNKKSPKEEDYIYYIDFEKSSSEYFVQECINPTIVCGLIPTFNNHADAKAVINNPNFKDILDLIYKGYED
jgi:hypothetical protein